MTAPCMGSHSYKLHLPKGIPAENFWAVTAYETPYAAGVDVPGQPIPSLSSMDDLVYKADGSIDIYFGPGLPEGAPKSNYIATKKGEGFFVVIGSIVRARPISTRPGNQMT